MNNAQFNASMRKDNYAIKRYEFDCLGHNPFPVWACSVDQAIPFILSIYGSMRGITLRGITWSSSDGK